MRKAVLMTAEQAKKLYEQNKSFRETLLSEFTDEELGITKKLKSFEEVKQPLFVTEDGVKVLSDIDNLYAVNLTYFNKTKNTLRHSNWLIENSAYKVFYHESNADEYIAWYKKKFSINDLLLANVGITTSQLDKLQELAKK